MAAQFIGECLDHGNFDAEVMSIWHDRWMDKFGSDYKWSVLLLVVLVGLSVLISPACFHRSLQVWLGLRSPKENPMVITDARFTGHMTFLSPRRIYRRTFRK